MKKKIKTPSNKVAEHRHALAEDYLYTVGWSEDDEAYVAHVAEFPSLAAHGASRRLRCVRFSR